MSEAPEQREPHDPTPAEIAERSKRIRKKWNDRTRRRRAGSSKEAAEREVTWEVPFIDLAGLTLPASDSANRGGEATQH